VRRLCVAPPALLALISHGLALFEVSRAVDKAFERQREFKSQLEDAGHHWLNVLAASLEPGIILVGRPYNIYDKTMNLDIPGKLRDYYGVNVIPADFIPVDNVDISDVNGNMYWHSGRKILAAARVAARYPNLHIIYITNFKCGPDSFIKHSVREASGKPFLSLQFDGHDNDAGFLTRCEAYLDSKGVLRRWRVVM
jgi:predicted nucleotide-binding protein (sugar kinase/HSP70/actin superfamily)